MMTQCKLCGQRPVYEDYFLCDECFGFKQERNPLSVENDVAVENKKKYRGKKLHPNTCTICGKGPQDTEFYPSEPYRCKPCHQDKARERKAKRLKTWTPLPVEEEVKMDNRGTTCEQEPLSYNPSTMIHLDFRRCLWALAWALEQSPNGNLAEHIVMEICEKVPEVWLKDFMMKSMSSDATH
jgi:hypothetical protein